VRGALALLCGAALLGGCAGGDAPEERAREHAPEERAREPVAAVPAAPAPAAPPPLKAAHCPPDLTNCRTASGRIVYVERVDPDGDGDAHFVLSSREAITLPGVSVIDVKKSLRPHPLPGPGDRISAAGPVYHGSYGQKQIEAIELHVAR
jgi:hypothetical protein